MSVVLAPGERPRCWPHPPQNIAVLAHPPPIATAVLAGSKSLDEAYNDVQIARGKINNDTIRLRKLRDVRPDDAGNRRWARTILAVSSMNVNR